MTTIPEQAIQAALNAYCDCDSDGELDPMRAALTVALPFLTGVKQEPIGYLFQHEDTGLTQVVDVQQVEWGFEKNNPRWQKISPVYAAPVSAPYPRAQALEEAAQVVERRIRIAPSNTKAFRAYQDACRHVLNDLRALSSQTVADGWLPIETAPKDGTEIWGGHKVAGPAQTRFYDGEWCCVDWYEDQYIACTWEPTHWRPLPSAPSGGDRHGE